MDEINNDKIKSAVIKVEALQKEYEVTLQQYQESGKNLINNLQSGNSNPCANYRRDSTGISQECYEKIWTDQGCTNLDSVDANSAWPKAQTLDTLVNDSFLWATLTDDTHRKGCYGDSTNFTTNTEPIYPDTNLFTALKGRTWWGTSGLKDGTASTQKECEDMCANTTQCSGATFNPVKRYCWARSGDSTITVGKSDDYALITSKKEILSTMKYLNQRLLDLNNEITNELRNINPEVQQQYNEKNLTQEQLNVSYDKLLEQNQSIKKDLEQHYSIEQEENNQTLFVNKEGLYYKLWIFLTFIVVFITIKQMVGVSVSSINDFVSNSIYST